MHAWTAAIMGRVEDSMTPAGARVSALHARCVTARGRRARSRSVMPGEEWGVPSHDDRHLFRHLVLRGRAERAGLSTGGIVLKKRRSTGRRSRADLRKIAPDSTTRIDARDPRSVGTGRRSPRSSATRATLAAQQGTGAWRPSCGSSPAGKTQHNGGDAASRGSSSDGRLGAHQHEAGPPRLQVRCGRPCAFMQATGFVNDT